MKKFTLSCGHEADSLDEGQEATIKSTNKWGEHVYYFGIYCHKCYDEYNKSGAILNNKKEIDDWIDDGPEYLNGYGYYD